MSVEWVAGNKFKVQDCNFLIDITPGYDRRPSTLEEFTIVKTREFVEIYQSLDLKPNSNILELGMFQGGSLVFMDKLLKPKKIVGIDISKKEIPALEAYKKTTESVSTYYGVSQDDERALENLITKEFDSGIDLIVDDASHLYEQTKKSYEILFNKLSSGGIYIIEDWSWSYKIGHQDPSNSWHDKKGMASLLFELIGDIASTNHIKYMQIFNCMAIIKKGNSATQVPVLQNLNLRGRDVPFV